VIYPYSAVSCLSKTLSGSEYFNPGLPSTLTAIFSEGYHQVRRLSAASSPAGRGLVNAAAAFRGIIGYTPEQRLVDFLGAPPCQGTQTAGIAAAAGGEKFDAEPALNKVEVLPGTTGSTDMKPSQSRQFQRRRVLWKRRRRRADDDAAKCRL